jgi:hypothetical protein
MWSDHLGVHGNGADQHLHRERTRSIEQQYAEILTTLGKAASMSGTPSAGIVLADAGKAMRRIACGLSIDPKKESVSPTAIYRLTYVSFPAERSAGLLLSQAREIAHVSAQRNRQDGITGALSVGGGWFAQVLEGPIRPLIACFDRILADFRHSDSRVLNFEGVDCRLFGDWSMAYSGEVAPSLVRQAVVDYVAQERHCESSASTSGRALVAAMAGNAKHQHLG